MTAASSAAAVTLLAACAAATVPAGEGAVGSYFDGPIEVVATSTSDRRFAWLESPLWSEEGQFLLFSDVKWADSAGDTAGMIFKYDEEHGVTELLPRAGVVGPGAPPANLAEYVEAGPNGMVWSGGDNPVLLVCQHGMHRIVSFSVGDVHNGSIADDKVTVVADEYDGAPLNSPNDMALVGGVLLFSDPPFGLQYRGDSSIDQAVARQRQNHTNVYALDPPFSGDQAPRLVLEDVRRPNGLAVSSAGKLFVAHTDFDRPGYSVYNTVGGDVTQVVLASERTFDFAHRIDPGAKDGLAALADGMTAHAGIVFAAGPGGVSWRPLAHSLSPWDSRWPLDTPWTASLGRRSRTCASTTS